MAFYKLMSMIFTNTEQHCMYICYTKFHPNQAVNVANNIASPFLFVVILQLSSFVEP